VIEETAKKNIIDQDTLILSPTNSSEKKPHTKYPISFSPAQVHMATNDDGDKQDAISKQGNQYDGIIEGSLTFSPDSKHLIYGVVSSDGQSVIVDGKEGKPYDSIIFIYEGGSIVFDSKDSFHYIARKGKGIYLVEEIAATVI